MMSELNMQDPNEIVAWFVPTEVPAGGAPEEIREKWVSAPLPVRYKNSRWLGGISVGAEAEDLSLGWRTNAVPIEAHDALISLELSGSPEAAGYWLRQMGGLPHEIFGTTLSFSGDEGEIIAADEVRQHIPLEQLFKEQEL